MPSLLLLPLTSHDALPSHYSLRRWLPLPLFYSSLSHSLPQSAAYHTPGIASANTRFAIPHDGHHTRYLRFEVRTMPLSTCSPIPMLSTPSTRAPGRHPPRRCVAAVYGMPKIHKNASCVHLHKADAEGWLSMSPDHCTSTLQRQRQRQRHQPLLCR